MMMRKSTVLAWDYVNRCTMCAHIMYSMCVCFQVRWPGPCCLSWQTEGCFWNAFLLHPHSSDRFFPGKWRNWNKKQTFTPFLLFAILLSLLLLPLSFFLSSHQFHSFSSPFLLFLFLDFHTPPHMSICILSHDYVKVICRYTECEGWGESLPGCCSIYL